MPRWKAQDNAWKGAQFVHTLSHIFWRPKNGDWMTDLLHWWNKYVPVLLTLSLLTDVLQRNLRQYLG